MIPSLFVASLQFQDIELNKLPNKIDFAFLTRFPPFITYVNANGGTGNGNIAATASNSLASSCSGGGGGLEGKQNLICTICGERDIACM